MRRYLPLLIGGSALIAAACRDTIAPTRSPNVDQQLAQLRGGPRSFASIWDSTLAYENAEVVTFTISPEGGMTRIGDFRLVYDSNSVCDPETSGYGPDTWLQSCQTLNEPITITGKFWFENGQAYADFSPNIRFAPEKNVYLWLKRPLALQSADQSQFEMWYSKVVDGTRFFVDEAYSDSTVATVIDEDGRVRRRVRHFSGYVIRVGEPCDDTAGDPGCYAAIDGY